MFAATDMYTRILSVAFLHFQKITCKIPGITYYINRLINVARVGQTVFIAYSHTAVLSYVVGHIVHACYFEISPLAVCAAIPLLPWIRVVNHDGNYEL